MYAVQIFNAAAAAIPGLEDSIAAGRFAPLREWLREKVHETGSLHPSGDELLAAVTGSPLQPQVYIKSLTAKYTDLYNLR